MFTRTHTRLSAWLAMLALVWGALAPTLAQAVVRDAPGPDSGWVEVCRSTGMVWVHLDTGVQREGEHPAAPESMAHAMADCVWCSVHGSAAGLPPGTDTAALAAGFVAPPSAGYRAPAIAALWRNASPRAPPLA